MKKTVKVKYDHLLINANNGEVLACYTTDCKNPPKILFDDRRQIILDDYAFVDNYGTKKGKIRYSNWLKTEYKTPYIETQIREMGEA